MHHHKHLWIALVGALALASACGESDDYTYPTTGYPSVGATASKVTDLKPGEAVSISVTVSDFVLDAAKMGQANEAGVGHYHVYWDDASSADFLIAAADDQVTVNVPSGASDGKHAFNVVLMNNDHTPLSPAVKYSVDVTVKAAAAKPAVSASADKTTDLLPGSPITLTITVENFKLDGAKMGQPAEAGVGHYHVYWDDSTGTNFLTATADSTVTVNVPSDATDGPHTLRVELMNNDHTPLSPPVMVKLPVTVKQ